MPIDPSILLAVKPPDPLPTPDELALKQAKIAQARELVQTAIDNARQRAQARQDAADIQNTLLQTHGDYELAHQQLSQMNPRADAALQKDWIARQDAQAKAAKEHIGALDAQTQWEAHLIQGVTPENASAVLPDIAKVNPDLVRRIAPNGQFDPKMAEALIAQADDTKDRLNRVAKAQEFVTKDPVKFVATMIDALPDKSPASITATLDSAENDYHVPRSVTSSFRQVPSDQVAQQANRLALGGDKVEELAGQAAARAETAKRDAAIQRNEEETRRLQERGQNLTNAHEQERIGLERQRLQGEQPIGLTAPIDPNAPHGDAFLKTIPQQAAMVKALAEGKQPWPSSFALKTPYWQDLMNKVFQYDPTFDTAQASNNARVKTRVDFTSGKSAQTINALNTVVGHVANLAAIGDQLGNSPVDFVNTVRNMFTSGGSERGTAINNFNLAKQAVASELTRVYRQAGGSEKDIEGWQASINAAKSPAELQGAWNTIGKLLESKLEAMQAQADQGLGADKLQIVTPEARRSIDRLTGGPSGSVPPQVLKAGPGRHTFANGQTWDVSADGKTATQVR